MYCVVIRHSVSILSFSFVAHFLRVGVIKTRKKGGHRIGSCNSSCKHFGVQMFLVHDWFGFKSINDADDYFGHTVVELCIIIMVF